MSCSSGSVDVVIESLDSKDSPHCQHGPTVLFERMSEGRLRRFYACSASRDRKGCSYFRWADKPPSKATSKAQAKIAREQQQAKYSHVQYKRRLQAFRQLPQSQRSLCTDCGQLILPAEVKGHEGHSQRTALSKSDLRRPTRLLPALDNNKTNAQYLFSDQTLNFIIKSLEDLKFKKILCVGAPRVHEEICMRNQSKRSELKSLLLDIDQRLEQFFTRRQFCRYNMFNHYFFRGQKSRNIYTDFLSESEGSLAVIMDPPFGGLVDILSHTLKMITNDWQAENPECSQAPGVFWIFPYFMQPRITQACPGLSMLDYKVEYDNHSVYSGQGKQATRGSPVRIFTSVHPSKVLLPPAQYRLCEPCERYVFRETTHCEACNSCTSQDGRQYTHCVTCQRCVKPSWCHCDKCDTCHLPDYKCQNPKTGCHICGASDHKRRDCPHRHSKDRPDKRQRREEKQQRKKRKR